MADRRYSVGRKMARQQSASGPPEVRMVSVAVLPPRLPRGMAPPDLSVIAGAVNWDERINWEHNEPIDKPEPGKGKSMMRKIGLTTQRERKNSDLPPFRMRQVPYDVWRKHYAKDKDGNYHGTHAPAEDCLLKPEDVAKWRLEEPKTKGDQWTRGAEALPVYSEVEGQGRVPDYEFEHVGIAPEPTLDHDYTAPPPDPVPAPHGGDRTGKVIADGKTAQDIIEEAKMKKEQNGGKKDGWKAKFKRGAEMAMLGGGN